MIYILSWPRFDWFEHFALDDSPQSPAGEPFFQDPRSANPHIIVHLSDHNLLQIDRNDWPLYASGSDNGQSTRVWVLNIGSGALTEIRPHNPNRFAISPYTNAW